MATPRLSGLSLTWGRGEGHALLPESGLSTLGTSATTRDDRLVHLDRYDFGKLVVDGREIRSDVLILPHGVVDDHWWRRDGHVLCLDALDAVLETRVKRLVVGTGAVGRMRPEPNLEPELASRGVVLELLDTAAAVDRVNQLLGLGATDWAAALHLTC